MKRFITSLLVGISVVGFSQAIRINQIGYFPNSEKIAVAVDLSESDGDIYNIIDLNTGKSVFSDTLKVSKSYDLAQETTRIADFSVFQTIGSYKITVGTVTSPNFEISATATVGLLKGILKSYFYNRCSSDDLLLDQSVAGKWTREGGHPDRSVYIHETAASDKRPAGTRIRNAYKGWYDAGDYNKYVVNAGITTYTMLSMYERYSAIFDTLNTNISESNNQLPDILDEALWNLYWMMGMQDPNDGGVYHKLSTLNFSPFVMPANTNNDRYMAMKSTAATLDFAAVMAQAARIFESFDNLPDGLTAAKFEKAAIDAWNWAQKNPTVRFTQTNNDFQTGAYSDNDNRGEKSWAASELYITTKDQTYYSSISKSLSEDNINWGNVYNLGVFSLYYYQHSLDQDLTWVEDKIVSFSKNWMNYYNTLPYKTAFGIDGYFFWGSNGVLGNVGMALSIASDVTKDEKYRLAGLSCLDYILGKNPTGYSFVTGFGSTSPMDPHHRISFADGVIEPIPGMVVNGVNKNPDSSNERLYTYPTVTAKKYLDDHDSHSTNEPAINYTIPFGYLAVVAEAKHLGLEPVVGIRGVEKNSTTFVSVFPNPAKNLISVTSTEKIYATELFTLSGQSVLTSSTEIIDISSLEKGMYIVSVTTEKGRVSKKLMVD